MTAVFDKNYHNLVFPMTVHHCPGLLRGNKGDCFSLVNLMAGLREGHHTATNFSEGQLDLPSDIGALHSPGN